MLKPENTKNKKQNVKTVNLYPFSIFSFLFGQNVQTQLHLKFPNWKISVIILQNYNFCQF